MTKYGLIEMANELAYAQAEYIATEKANQQAKSEKSASEITLRQEMVKEGVDRFDLDEYREVVWDDERDELLIIPKGDK